MRPSKFDKTGPKSSNLNYQPYLSQQDPKAVEIDLDSSLSYKIMDAKASPEKLFESQKDRNEPKEANYVVSK